MQLTDKEIKKIKTDFVRKMKENKIYKTKAEIKEDLVSYRSLFTIKDDVERVFVNQMITTSKNIPDSLIGKWKNKKVGRKNKNAIITCDICETPLENMTEQKERIVKTFNTSFYSTLREVKLEVGQKHCPNYMCVNYNQIIGA